MNAPAQRALWDEPEPTSDDASTDAYCTPPEVMDAVRDAAGKVTLDPWSNNYAIAHGFVRAEQAWTLADGRDPDPEVDPRVWPIDGLSFVWGNPPYSDPAPFIRRFATEVARAGCWGMLLLKTDNRTRWWATATEKAALMVLWRGPINFFHQGQRVKGNNFPSALFVVDGTGIAVERRQRQLRKAFEKPGLGWVYR